MKKKKAIKKVLNRYPESQVDSRISHRVHAFEKICSEIYDAGKKAGEKKVNVEVVYPYAWPYVSIPYQSPTEPLQPYYLDGAGTFNTDYPEGTVITSTTFKK